MQKNDLPETHYQVELRRNAEVAAENERRERIMLRQRLDAKGVGQDKPGSMMHVRLDRSVRDRTRSGIRFNRDEQIAVAVVDATDQEVKDARAGVDVDNDSIRDVKKRGFHFVNPYMADLIRDDGVLHVSAKPWEQLDGERAQAENERLTNENEALRRKLASLERDARKGAPESKDGEPTRLKAAAEVRSKAARTDFGDGSDPNK